ncbi:hypothetical protein GS597_18825 [Synechococcales cyanobacterium C]|uniref:Uncharacterized protein n=1 Tax=Petrachloros mirabilis ULC683 TaxID=2781853 RepID=A0A8K2A8Y0_9CYAN|nr:hypothetical protein [Petrachloros mirabilis]NCJ08524.1 hypothetical protein [Petrachloros mirabilis ULC683]
MKTQTILSISALLLGMGALPSVAGEAFVTNSHSWQNITNGRGYSETKFQEKYEGYRLGLAGAIKYEEGYSFSEEKGKGLEYLAASGSLNAEVGKFKQNTYVFAYQDYRFTGGSDSHSVSSGFRY